MSKICSVPISFIVLFGIKTPAEDAEEADDAMTKDSKILQLYQVFEKL
jgi:hypothetical protein